jgi:methylenetetrahydrofolate dehydrogenase (NADP+) / methenyltetrahydrofolate cyclohydrolase
MVMAERLDGRLLAQEVRAHLAQRVLAREVLPTGAPAPGLLLIRVGEDPASKVYVHGKEKAAREVGIDSTVEVLPESTSEAELITRIDRANTDPAVHGLLVQLPLPRQIRAEVVAEAIDPEKDVDGLHPINQGRLALGRPGLIACTPLGVLTLLHRHGIALKGRHVVVLGRSAIVGRPLSLLLSQKAEWADATVTLCHSRSRDLPAITRGADILIAAMGRARAVTGDMVRPGAVVVDVGMHRLADPTAPKGERLVGDVDPVSVEPVAGWLSPVPGGVGPLTVAMLLANTVGVWERARGLEPRPIWEALGLRPTSGPGESISGDSAARTSRREPE